MEAIPYGIRMGIGPAMGLMLMNIGLGSNAGIYSETGGPFYVMRDFFGALTTSTARANLGSAFNEMVLTVVTMFIGLFCIIIFANKKTKGAVLLGMLISSIIYWVCSALFLHVNPFAELAHANWIPPISDMISTTFFKFNIEGLSKIGLFTVTTLIITFCIIDVFDTIGSFVGTSVRAGLVDEQGKMKHMKEALVADAPGTLAGSIFGTSTVTTFVESASGVEEGGRTGLTSFTTGVLFLACIFISPIAAIIPPAATSAALVYVGILMLQGLSGIDFSDMEQIVPVALMLLAMPISESIGHAIGIGIISFTTIRLLSGKIKDVSIITIIVSILFLIKFFFGA